MARRSVAWLLGFSLLLTACQSTTPTPTAPILATAVSTSSDSKPPGGAGMLRYRLAAAPDNLDPQAMSAVDEIGTGALVFEGLMALDAQLNIVPGAAAQMAVSPDGLQYTLTLRPNLTYSDGTPLTAHHFAYAWHRLFDPHVPNRQYSSIAYDIVGAEELDHTSITDTGKFDAAYQALGVQAPDDRHIIFTLKRRAAYFPAILALWIGWPSRQDRVEQGGAQWTTDPQGAYYISNGPFILTRYDDQHGFTFRANPRYRQGAPAIQEIQAVIIPDGATAVTAYRQGEIDVLQVPAENYPQVQTDPALARDLITTPGDCTLYLSFNVTKPPFDNIHVRQAFAQALDRQDYVTQMQQGAGQVAWSLIPPGRPGYAPDIQLWPFDPATARQTLAVAGYPNGQGLPPITLTHIATARSTARVTWIQQQIQTHLGITVSLDPVQQPTYTALTKDPATAPQLFNWGACQDYPDPQDWLTLGFHSAATVTPSGWKNDQFDTLTRQADAEPDPARRLQWYHQAQELLVREAPVVFLYWDVHSWLIPPYITGMKEYISPQDADLPGFFNIVNTLVGPH